MPAAKIAQAAERLARARRPTALTGAGVSTPSGVPTVRGPNGLWSWFRPEVLTTREAFGSDPRPVRQWYQWRRRQTAECVPNRAHQVRRDWNRAVHYSGGAHRALAGDLTPIGAPGAGWTLRGEHSVPPEGMSIVLILAEIHLVRAASGRTLPGDGA